MRFSAILTAALFTLVAAEPAIVNLRGDALTSPFLDRRADTVLTLDGRLISRQDCCEDPPGCGCASATCCPNFPGCAC
ncbi:hypothetical protein CONPUDRAFT_87090 [Coniophora puteana RWD-64-598 SS2]|uniref:Uncharacterized protein n=1 Tax=Coniophora puteana (strain RWD-64-598) TaxID=741705 RepID=A0A5M3N7Q9_CONPW|nr:uncharacterized protein CONPUDRAFT_87090 [Coniophora puteana RWD-64-598 SS2]EIW87197.1 hypothetical protein CONPUDRAFT_87090 [Coniophora puteana RWD-64-598 SS2]